MFRRLLGLSYADIRLLWGGAPELAELEGSISRRSRGASAGASSTPMCTSPA